VGPGEGNPGRSNRAVERPACLLLVLPFSSGQLSLEKVVTTSEPSGITVIACEVKA
jgi:hypothetical protein